MDVFQCRHESHADFHGRVSAYHVLREKKCYPDGCLSFIWNCTRLSKGTACIRRHRTVGKSCKGCTYFIEDKIHMQPDCLLEPEAYDRFLEDLENFETWLQSMKYKRVSLAGRIRTVKPHYRRLLYTRESHTRLHGYLLALKPAYIAMDCFQDTLYIRVSEGQMKALHFAPKMKLECTGEIRLDRGRLIVHRPGRFEIIKPGRGKPWTRERALVSIKTAKPLKSQPAQCLSCGWSVLVDTEDHREIENDFRRELFCLKGIEDYHSCYIQALRKQKRKNRKSRISDQVINS